MCVFQRIININFVTVVDSIDSYIRIFEALTLIILIQIHLYGYSIIEDFFLHWHINTNMYSLTPILYHLLMYFFIHQFIFRAKKTKNH